MSTAVPNNGSSQVATQQPAPSTRSSRGGDNPFTDIASGRKTTNSIMGGLMWLCMIVALIPLVWLLDTVVSRGMGAVLDPAWWTEDMVGVRSSKPGRYTVVRVTASRWELERRGSVDAPDRGWRVVLRTARAMTDDGEGRALLGRSRER